LIRPELNIIIGKDIGGWEKSFVWKL